MKYCTKCGKPTDNGIMCKDCMILDSPWLFAMKSKEDDLVEQIKKLKSENAALRERLDKAVEIPDYVFECINGEVERIFTEYLTVGELKNLEANGYSLTKEAAEARLAELKGEKE